MLVSSPATVLTVVGAIVAVAGGLMGAFVFPKIVKSQVEENSILTEGTEKFEYWQTSKVPVVFKIYFFNVTNAEEVQKGAKPEVKEIGPYVYNQYKKKINITYTDDVISFRQYQVFEFDEKATAPLRDTDKLTIVNLPLMGTLLKAESLPAGLFSFVSLGTVNMNIPTIFSDPTSIFMTTSPRDFLFDGIPLMCNGTHILSARYFICNIIEQYAPVTMPRFEDGTFRFSLYGWKNNTDLDSFSLNTGKTDVYKIGETSAWQDKTTMNVWPGSTCNEISGTDGGLFPPFRTNGSVLKIFNTDVCRPVEAHYYGKKIISGLEANRYIIDEKLYDSPSNNSANECFCLPATNDILRNDGCLLDGVIDVSKCQGAPAIISFPHFYRAHEDYQNGVDGLRPNKSLHSIFLDLEPLSGTLLHGTKRAQLNILIKPINHISLTTNLRPTLMPIIWFEETYDGGEDVITILNAKLFSVLDLVSDIKWGIIAGGILLFVLGLVWMLRSVYGRPGFRKINLIITEKSDHVINS